jgi:hypothetical protein
MIFELDQPKNNADADRYAVDEEEFKSIFMISFERQSLL